MTNLEKEMAISACSAAVHFHEVAFRCLQDLSNTGIAITTNIAFACELYLKAALMSEGRAAKGHDLKSLFDDLPQVHREELEALYKLKMRVGDPDLLSSLNEVREAFIESRYIYEQAQAQIRFGVLGVFASIAVRWLSKTYPHLQINPLTLQRLG